MSRGEFLFEFIMEVFPVEELVGPGILRFLFPTEDAGSPLLSMTRFHIGHGPYDFGLFICKVLGTESYVGLTGIQECYSLEQSPSNSIGTKGRALRDFGGMAGGEVGVVGMGGSEC